MINVNFFEKEKTNILPYIAGGVFFILLVLMGAYFLIVRGQLNKSIENNNAWISENAEEVAISRQISQMDQLQKQSVEVQEILRSNQYPTNPLVAELVSVIPNEIDRISTIQLTESNQIMLVLENIQTNMGQEIIEDIENLSFVSGVQFLYAENQTNSANDEFHYELTVDLDPSALNEEGQNEN